MMCIDKSDVHDIVEKHISAHQASLEKGLKLQFQFVNENIGRVLEKVTTINGRVGTTETKVRLLEDYRISRITDCPYKDQVNLLTQRMLEELNLEEIMRKMEEKREKTEDKRNKNLKLRVTIIALLLSALTFTVNYFF